MKFIQQQSSKRSLLLSVLLFLVVALSSHAQQSGPDREPRIDPTAELHTFRLWEKAAPGALGDKDEDVPTLTIYPATGHDKPTAAIVVAPGGSYHHLAANHEGRQIANWFNAMGITAFVLQYRLGPRYHHPIELGDAQRARSGLDRSRRALSETRHHGPGAFHDGSRRLRRTHHHACGRDLLRQLKLIA